MNLRNAFFAYAATPGSIGELIERAAGNVRDRTGTQELTTWKHLDICGHFIANQVLGKIAERAALIADITKLNFNVVYELGYAIGLRKPIFIVKNGSLNIESISLSDLGIFDTLGYIHYHNSEDLTALLVQDHDLSPIDYPIGQNSRQPAYIVEPKFKIEFISRLNSRLGRARLAPRRFDPNEQPRLSPFDAINNVAESYGIVVPLIAPEIQDARLHNLRAAFVAGLAQGMEKVHLVLQEGDSPVPIDYRDLAKSCSCAGDLDLLVADFAALVTEQFTKPKDEAAKVPENYLQTVDLGGSTAENELRDLPTYYHETNAYQQVARGEARVVVGRKGSGKTAIFYRSRDRVRKNKQMIVLDLKPESYQLQKLRDFVVDLLQKGSREHLVMAFWEYILYLEICAKVLSDDADRHIRDPQLYEKYWALAQEYGSDELIVEGDFSDRLEKIADGIVQKYADHFGASANATLSNAEVTDLVYRHDLSRLKKLVGNYLQTKAAVWIFFDNLDKGWPSHGVQSADLLMLRALLEATRKIERDLSRTGTETHTVVFVRNDVFEMLLEETPDRGKERRIAVDWTDSEMLREVLRRRILRENDDGKPFVQVWASICVPLVDGQESSQYLIDRCLMRPRALIELANHCRSFAVNLRHQRIEDSDIEKGLTAFSHDLVTEINLEIRDIMPQAEDVLYHFIGTNSSLTLQVLNEVLLKGGRVEAEIPQILDILIWHGVLGLIWPDGRIEYIYNANYNIKLFRAQIKKLEETGLVFQINPAFWPALLGIGVR